MSEIVGIWMGFQSVSILKSDGIDTLVDTMGNVNIRVDGQTLPN